MTNKNPRLPYNHLEILGISKLKPYIPPSQDEELLELANKVLAVECTPVCPYIGHSSEDDVYKCEYCVACTRAESTKYQAAVPLAKALKSLIEHKLKAELKSHIKKWKDDTGFMSCIKTEHESYQAIIKMGKVVLPFLLKEMIETPNHFSHALIAISGENPIPQEIAGNLDLIVEVWKKWGIEKGLI